MQGMSIQQRILFRPFTFPRPVVGSIIPTLYAGILNAFYPAKTEKARRPCGKFQFVQGPEQPAKEIGLKLYSLLIGRLICFN